MAKKNSIKPKKGQQSEYIEDVGQELASISGRHKVIKQQIDAQNASLESQKVVYESIAKVQKKGVDTDEAAVEVKKRLKKEQDSLTKAAKETKKEFDAIEESLDQIGGSGVQGMRELADVIKSASKGGKGLSTAIFALGAAAGGLAYNFGLVGNKVKTAAKFDKKIAEISGNIAIANLEIERGGFGGRNFVADKAAVEFAGSIASSAASFRAASKTALFGKGLGSVGYGAAQLEMAGISAETIASGMQAAANETGKMPTGKVGADMAILAARTGQSAESIASINDAFMRMDGVSAKTALNLQEGVRAMADKAGVNLGGVMEEMAGASKEMLGYQIKSASSLAKQVVFAKSMGVSFNEIAKAGQSMVLNYKDSIKAEMSLSAMLGKNVDLSEVRAKFASGDTEGAMKALKAQGLNPAEMDMFQQQQLQQALGGMDLTSLQKIATRTGTTGGELKAGAVGAGNQQFLSTTQAAQATLNAENASISSRTAIQLAAIDRDLEMAKEQAVIDNTGGLNDLKTELAKQEGLKDAMIGLETAMYSLIGGGLASGLEALFKRFIPGVGKKEATKAVAKTAAKTGTKVAAKTAATVGTKAAAKTGTKVAAKTAAKVGTKGLAKAGAKTVGKSLLKKIPVVGLLAGVGFGLQRLMSGDMAGAALELASGAAGTIPGIGTAASIGIDTAIAARDMGAFDSKVKPETKPTAQPKTTTPTTAKNATAGTTSAKPGSTSVTAAAKTHEKWIEEKMKYMSGNLERVVDRTTKTMINTAATTKELKTLNTNTKAIMNLTRTIEALTVATYQGKGNVELKIDGKRVAYSFNKYNENTKNTVPTTPTTTTNTGG